MAIRHVFTSPKADEADATLVRPSNWNADHTGTVAAADVPIVDAGGRYTAGEAEAALQEIAGAGRTTQTVKENADAIIDLAGAGRTTETVKANADAIATKVPTTRQVIAGIGLSGGGDLSVDRTLTLAIPHFHTIWINRSDWTNVHLGSDTTLNVDSYVTHGLNTPLPQLLPELWLSTDGTDALSFQIPLTALYANVAGANYYDGAMAFGVDDNNIRIQTGTQGLWVLDDNGILVAIDTENWYYQIRIYFLG